MISFKDNSLHFGRYIFLIETLFFFSPDSSENPFFSPFFEEKERL
jgi:hypothetical protein